MTLPGDDLPIGDDTTLEQAKAWLRARLRAGERCPCCTQRAQVYRRPINTATALFLIEAVRRFRGVAFHLPTAFPARGDTAKARYWGLIATADGDGMWVVTPEGERFARGALAIPRYALVYDSRCLGFEGDPVTIRDCLPNRFDLDALLEGRA